MTTGFNYVDGIVAAIVLLGIVGGVRRGLSGELALVGSMAVAGIASWKLSEWATRLLMRNTALEPRDAAVTSVVILFAIIYLILWVIRRSMRSLMDYSFKGKTERIGGALSGLLRGLVLAVLVVMVATFIPNEGIQKAVTADSFTGSFVFRKLQPFYEDIAGSVPGLKAPKAPKAATEPAGEAPTAGEPPKVMDVDSVTAGEVPAGEELGPVDKKK